VAYCSQKVDKNPAQFRAGFLIHKSLFYFAISQM
jgi:hypothetical protein